LLITADTPSRLVHPCEKATAPLFGDAAVATLLEADTEDNDLLGVDLGTDGRGWANLIQPVGQQRFRSAGAFAAARPESLAKIEHPDYVYMNGAEIFTFTLREVPGIVQRTLAAAGLEIQDVDCFFFHQANKFILDHLIRKMRLPPEKCLLSIDRFGNTSGPSPAVTACAAAARTNRDRPLVAMFVGFGVGYSWGGALVRLRPGTLWPVEETE
jgi:3-oxoacyl-[acyl-carrier-protein] synthase-3